MSEGHKSLKLQKLPIIIKRNPGDRENFDFILQYPKLNNLPPNLFKEDVIYNASENDFLKGKYPRLTITNRLNILKNSSRTSATYENGSDKVELNSDSVSRLIGQKKYDTVFSALCSIINQELRIEGILSLLTIDSKKSVESQTDQTSRNIIIRENKRRVRKNKKVTSYVVRDHILQKKKVVIDPETILEADKQIKLELDSKEDVEQKFPETLELLNEDSNFSVGSGKVSIGNFSIPDLLDNPKSILNNIDKHTEEENEILNTITLLDGSVVTIKGNPDKFQLASPEILKTLSSMDQKRLMFHQAYIDWKFCLERDEDGYLPLHLAVLNRDVNLLRRHCVVLQSHSQSVDILTEGNLTALQMSILNDSTKCTPVLLQHGADPLTLDEESRTPLHLAAEVSSEHVHALIKHCTEHAREIFKENEDLCGTYSDSKSDKELANHLLYKMCSIFDSQGYTPLMLASKLAKHENVQLLLEAAPSTVNLAMPTSGNTALYLAVAAACIDSIDRDDNSKTSPDFLKTVEHLVTRGANPDIENSSGNSVNMLLTENLRTDLTLLIANTFLSTNFFNGTPKMSCDNYYYVKDDKGNLNIEELKSRKNKSNEVRLVNIRLNETQSNEGNAKNNETQSNESNAKNDETLKAVTNVEDNKKIKEKTSIVIDPLSLSNKEKTKPVIIQNLPVLTLSNKKKPIILKKNAKPSNELLAKNSKARFVKILPKAALKRVSDNSEASSSKKAKP